MALVDVDEKRLKLAGSLGRKINRQMKRKWKVTCTTDRREVLSGADYVVNCIEVSGVDCVRFDNDIPAKYGVSQCIGDTIGPGGLFKALRTVPVFIEVLRDIEKLCPDAWVLNYTNPMSIMCLAAWRTSSVKVVGLCHSVQGNSHYLANVAGVPYEEMRWRCAGINHHAWFTELTHKGRDLYPMLLDKAFSDKEIHAQNPARWDIMKHFGYFVTESNGHYSEYVPYYRKRPDLLKLYGGDGYTGASGFYADSWPTWRKNNDKKRRRQVAGKEPINTDRSWEFCSYIIQAMETHEPFIIHGNVPNRGLIDNLPQDGVVEVPCVVNADGVNPVRFGRLPPACAALSASNMRMFDLAASACIEKDRRTAAQALMLDPLTMAVCAPAEIQKMTDELFKAEKKFLPGF